MQLYKVLLILSLILMPRAYASLSFTDFDKRAQAGEELSVVFLGGSLTWGAQATDPQKTSYRAVVSKALQERYPTARFSFADAAIGGTGSQLGAFRLQRDVLAYEPDLVFLDFTINDGAHAAPNADRLAAYEALVRRLLSEDALVVQAIFPMKRDLQQAEPVRPLDAEHKAIAKAYNLPSGDAVALIRGKFLASEVTPDEVWDLPEDDVHPGDKGYALYAEAVWNAYLNAVESGVVSEIPEKMLHASHYMDVDRFRLASLPELPQGWSRGVPHRTAIAFDFVCSRWMDDLVIAQAKEGQTVEPLRIVFKGRNVLVFGEGTQKSGEYGVRIDGGPMKTFKTRVADGNMRRPQMVAMGLDPEQEHVLEIIPLLKDGQELRLESICVAGGKVLGGN